MSEENANASLAPAQPSSLRLIVTLGLIAMMSGLLVVSTDHLTAARIQANEQAALEKAVFAVLPEAAQRRDYHLSEDGLVELTPDSTAEPNLFAGYDADGKLVGLAMEAASNGYAGVVKILYGYNLETECVTGFIVLQSTETPGLGDKVSSDPDFLANFDALDASLNESRTAIANEIVTVKNGKKQHPWQIDGISGATVTSIAIGDGLRGSTTEMLPLLERFRDSFPLEVEPLTSTAPVE